jgi:hypothetical protein
MGEPPLEPADCFEKGRIGQQVTGKELDEETGLYYFGARYYDPQISSWISTDPALPEYLPTSSFFNGEDKNSKFDQWIESKYKLLAVSENKKESFKNEYLWDYDRIKELKGQGGVFNSPNNAPYTYVHNNPVKLVDPDGKFAWIPVIIVGAALGAALYKAGAAIKEHFEFIGKTNEVKNKIDDLLINGQDLKPGQSTKLLEIREKILKGQINETKKLAKELATFPGTLMGGDPPESAADVIIGAFQDQLINTGDQNKPSE